MDRSRYQDYFVRPLETSHRRYEAMRAVFVEQRSMKEVAQQFEVSHGTVRNWASEFRRQQDAGLSPPFSLPRLSADPHSSHTTVNLVTNRKSKPLM